jgi:hypothetical protein
MTKFCSEFLDKKPLKSAFHLVEIHYKQTNVSKNLIIFTLIYV